MDARGNPARGDTILDRFRGFYNRMKHDVGMFGWFIALSLALIGIVQRYDASAQKTNKAFSTIDRTDITARNIAKDVTELKHDETVDKEKDQKINQLESENQKLANANSELVKSGEKKDDQIQAQNKKLDETAHNCRVMQSKLGKNQELVQQLILKLRGVDQELEGYSLTDIPHGVGARIAAVMHNTEQQKTKDIQSIRAHIKDVSFLIENGPVEEHLVSFNSQNGTE